MEKRIKLFSISFRPYCQQMPEGYCVSKGVPHKIDINKKVCGENCYNWKYCLDNTLRK